MLNNLIARMYLFTRREEGQAMAEYGIILALVAVAAVVVLGLLGTQVHNAINSLVTAITPKS